MASFVPAKSLPLHNFELPPLLKWKKDGQFSGNTKRRRSMKSPPHRRDAASVSPPRCSPLRDSPRIQSPARQSPDSAVLGGDSMKQAPVCEGMKELATGGDSEGARYSRDRDWSSESEASRKGKGGVTVIEYHSNYLKKSAFCSLTKGDGSSNSEEEKSKPLIESKEEEEDNRKEKMAAKIENNDEDGEIDDEAEKEGKISNNLDEDDTKLWNLRPRNVKKKVDSANDGGEDKMKNKAVEKEKKERCEDKKKKLSICIALTKEEIEDDIYALTGTKASRRPKRRPKNVQKQLDVAFPGLWLLSITPESYKVSENSLKG